MGMIVNVDGVNLYAGILRINRLDKDETPETNEAGEVIGTKGTRVVVVMQTLAKEGGERIGNNREREVFINWGTITCKDDFYAQLYAQLRKYYDVVEDVI